MGLSSALRLYATLNKSPIYSVILRILGFFKNAPYLGSENTSNLWLLSSTPPTNHHLYKLEPIDPNH